MNLHDETYQLIGAALVDDAPSGWTTLVYRSLHAGTVGESELLVTRDDGSVEEAHGSSRLPRLMRKLRKQMYDPQRGPWYTATVTLTNDFRLSFDFDYDHEPEWAWSTPPIVYVEDVERFPRDVGAYPEWLVQRLVEARNGRARESGAANLDN